MAVSRREVLRLAGMLGLLPFAPTLVACGDGGGGGGGDGLPQYEYDGALGPEDLFRHGVASGDPLADAVILWTRVTPDAAAALEVFWEVARDVEFTDRVGAGWTTTDAERDFTVKLDVGGLAAGTTYHYRFRALGRGSLVGRTRTAPQGSPERLRFAVASCSNYAHGYFHAYRRIAERADLDAVIHLGDYIYEYGDGGYGDQRALDPPTEIVTLDDYRRRYAHYRADPDLQAAHQQHPFITVWDDHESANDSWRGGAENHQPSEGDWALRRAIAERVYAEWMPIRALDGGRIWRALRFGDLVDIVMLDTRLWGRDPQPPGANDASIFATDRTLLGADQEAWLLDQLRGSRARWRVLGQQVMLGQLKAQGLPNSEGGGVFLNGDQWDGYQAARARLLAALRDEALDNVVVLTGDIHTSWAIDLCEDPNNPQAYNPLTGAGALAVEFVTPGVTSPGVPGGNAALLPIAYAQNPHIKFGELEQRGYLVLDVTPQRAQAAWFHLDDVTQPTTAERFAAAYAVYDGAAHVVSEAEPA